MPALIIGGWRDGLLRGSPEMYQRLRRRRGVETRLYIDPCTHKGCGAPFAPFTNPPGREDLAALVFEFLDKHLRGAKTPARPRVRYYLQAANRFVDADRWPPAGTGFAAARPGGGHAVLLHQPRRRVQPRVQQVRHGRRHPVRAHRPAGGDRPGSDLPHPGARQRARPDRATGLRLIASSTASDTDWHAKLSDVAPDGSETLITEGALRASHRALDRAKSTPVRPYHPHTNPQPIQPGRFYPYDIEIEPTAYRLARGHRLQLRVTSTDLPTHLPGSFAFSRSRPQDVRVNLHPPATNSVRLEDSYLSLPAAGRDGGGIGVCLVAALAHRPAQHRAHPARLHPRPDAAGAGARSAADAPQPALLREALARPGDGGVRRPLAAGAGEAGRDHRRGHGNRRVRVGSRASRFRRAYANRVRIGRGLYRARRGSPRLFGIRRGRVRFIAVAPRSVARAPRALRRYLRLAGLR